jgi:hypothetical protein
VVHKYFTMDITAFLKDKHRRYGRKWGMGGWEEFESFHRPKIAGRFKAWRKSGFKRGATPSWTGVDWVAFSEWASRRRKREGSVQKVSGGFRAVVTEMGRNIYLGTYKSPDEARTRIKAFRGLA